MEKNKLILEMINKNYYNKLTNSNKDLLELFSYFIFSSRPDFNYNETYLKDYISEFDLQLALVEKKGKISNTIFQKISLLKLAPNTKLEILIDNIYILKSGEKGILISEEHGIKKLFNNISLVNIMIEGPNGRIERTGEYDLSNNKNLEDLYEKIKKYVDKSEEQ